MGLSKDDITDMVLTHLHFDHTGGSIEWNEDKTKLIPAFKNAKYWVSKAQWEWATKPNKREKASFLGENIQPMEESGQLKIIDKEGELFPNFHVKLYNGHTDGQVIPHINYKGRTVVFMADLLQFPQQPAVGRHALLAQRPAMADEPLGGFFGPLQGKGQP